MSELSAQAGSEGYGACADEAQGRSPCTEHQRRKEPEPSEVPALTSHTRPQADVSERNRAKPGS